MTETEQLVTAMLITCGCSLKSVVGACLLSAVAAGTICALPDRVVADNAAAVAASVNRTHKGDQLGITQRAGHNSAPSKKAVLPKKIPPGCEAAFSPFADPGRPDALNYCVT